MKVVKIGLIGLGTVGGGTLTVLNRNAEEISRRAGCQIRIIVAVVRVVNKSRRVDTSGILLTDDVKQVVDNPDVDIVVELMGGVDETLPYILRALDNGKHLVTANKALVAIHGVEILKKAQQKGLRVAFEAAVAGGIPIVKSIREGLAANRIEWVAGIINGTSNYILSEMQSAGRGFMDVLNDAQALGYAEADPTFDIEGVDAAHKLTILASIAFGISLQFDKVYVEGITQITEEDIAFADELGCNIKHIGLAKRTNQGVELRVHPTLVPRQHLIANVNGVMNAVLVQADAVGQTLYYGAGAGAEPTASAVVADIIDIVRASTKDPENHVSYLAFQPDSFSNETVLPIEQVETACYLRLSAINQPGVMASIATIFGDSGISIESLLQKSQNLSDRYVTIIIQTQITKEAYLIDAVQQLEALPTVKSKVMRIRMESFR